MYDFTIKTSLCIAYIMFSIFQDSSNSLLCFYILIDLNLAAPISRDGRRSQSGPVRHILHNECLGLCKISNIKYYKCCVQYSTNIKYYKCCVQYSTNIKYYKCCVQYSANIKTKQKSGFSTYAPVRVTKT